MKSDCDCSYCKNNNECEVNHWYDGITLCPKCHPKELEYTPSKTNKKYNIFRKMLDDP